MISPGKSEPASARPVRVLHPITRLIVGGAQENTLYTASMLDPSRFQVEVLSGTQTGSEGSLIEELHDQRVPLTLLPELRREVSPLHDLLATLKMARFLRRGQFQIVHTHSSKAGILGRIAARLAGVPTIVHTIHGWSFHEHMPASVRKTYITLERITARFTDALVVVSQQDIQKGLQAGIGRPDQYKLIHSAIPLERFDPAQVDRQTIRQELGLPLNAPVLGCVGRFSEQKNPLDWVALAGRVAQQLPDCRFLLVGDGPLRSQVESALHKEGIANRTMMTGLRRDVPRMLSAMDVFLLTSLWEGLPRVVPQALAMKVPVVAYPTDGVVEAIQHGKTGYLADPRDFLATAGLILDLLHNPARRQAMGLRGQEYVRKEFNLQRMVAEIEALYDSLLLARDR